MNTSETAAFIGCSPQHVRTLIREGKLTATQVPLYRDKEGNMIHMYSVSREEASRYKKLPITVGYPRGRKRV